jgi:hypothetical protein
LFQFQEHYYMRSKEGDKCRSYGFGGVSV